jgi:hypothetical protein
MVDDRDLVVEEVLVGFIQVNALLDDALAIAVERKAAAFEGARTLEATRLDLEHVVTSVAVAVDPPPDRIAVEAWQRFLGPVAAVREDAARRRVVGIVVDDLRRDDELDRKDRNHHARQAVRQAEAGRIAGQPAARPVGEDLFEDRLVFGGQRRLLPAARWLGGVPGRDDSFRPAPLAGPVGIFRTIVGACDRSREAGENHRGNQGSRAVTMHRGSP